MSEHKYREPKYAELPDTSSRTVKPLASAQSCTLPLMAIYPDRTVVSELTGQVTTFEHYCEHLPQIQRHLVITYSSETWLWLLNERWASDPRWTWQVMVQHRPNAKMRQHVSYYGFRPHRGKRKVPFTNMVIDAGSFTNDMDTDLIDLGVKVRSFCNEHGLRMRGSAPGIANQLLRHPLFYPDPRRCVPRFVNNTARKHLPGPFYESYTNGVQRIEAATYIDQEAAYHFAALETPLPNANSIRAAGFERGEGVYARAGGELYEREMRKHGLLHVEAIVPHFSAKRERFLPRTMREPGKRKLWLWTNEIPYLEKMGLRILHLISVWGTDEIDTGMKRYAQWARGISRANPHLKALLLMPYGALGRRPDKIKLHSPHGGDDLLLAGQWIEGTRSHSVRVKTYTANALQLGLIQAHVRTLSLDMAQQLSAKGEEVISVYADGIFIRLGEDRQIPMFAPWRLKEDSLELHLNDSLRVPVRAAVRRDYMAAQVAATDYIEGTVNV